VKYTLQWIGHISNVEMCVGKHSKKGPHGRPRNWNDNIKMNHRLRRWEAEGGDSWSSPLTSCGINDVESSHSACNQSVSILRCVSAHEETGGGGIRDEEVIIITIRTCNDIRYRTINKA
jgi:hypothetical protein